MTCSPIATPTSDRSRAPSRAWSPDAARRGADTSSRGPAARAGAAGPRRDRPPLRQLRPGRGCDPGSADRRGQAVAGRRRAGVAEGLAGDGGVPPPDRRAPEPSGPPASRGHRAPVVPGAVRQSGLGRGTRRRRRRLAGAAVPGLPPLPLASVADRAHAPLGRRAVDGRDRQGVPGPGSDDDPAHHPGQADDQGERRAVPHARRRPSSGNASTRCCTRSTSSSTRDTPPPPAPDPTGSS